MKNRWSGAFGYLHVEGRWITNDAICEDAIATGIDQMADVIETLQMSLLHCLMIVERMSASALSKLK